MASCDTLPPTPPPLSKPNLVPRRYMLVRLPALTFRLPPFLAAIDWREAGMWVWRTYHRAPAPSAASLCRTFAPPPPPPPRSSTAHPSRRRRRRGRPTLCEPLRQDRRAATLSRPPATNNPRGCRHTELPSGAAHAPSVTSPPPPPLRRTTRLPPPPPPKRAWWFPSRPSSLAGASRAPFECSTRGRAACLWPEAERRSPHHHHPWVMRHHAPCPCPCPPPPPPPRRRRRGAPPTTRTILWAAAAAAGRVGGGCWARRGTTWAPRGWARVAAAPPSSRMPSPSRCVHPPLLRLRELSAGKAAHFSRSLARHLVAAAEVERAERSKASHCSLLAARTPPAKAADRHHHQSATYPTSSDLGSSTGPSLTPQTLLGGGVGQVPGAAESAPLVPRGERRVQRLIQPPAAAETAQAAAKVFVGRPMSASRADGLRTKSQLRDTKSQLCDTGAAVAVPLQRPPALVVGDGEAAAVGSDRCGLRCALYPRRCRVASCTSVVTAQAATAGARPPRRHAKVESCVCPESPGLVSQALTLTRSRTA